MGPHNPPTFPSLLIIADEGPDKGTAGGLVQYRLLKDYPAEKVRVLARGLPAPGRRHHFSYSLITPRWQRLEKSRFHRWHRSLRSLGLVPGITSTTIDSLIPGFHPEIVLTVMQFSSVYDIAARYARDKGLPLVVLVHDVNEEWEPVFSWAKKQRRRRDGAFYRQAAARLCISDEMEAFCRQAYGVSGSVQYPNRDDGITARSPENAFALRRPGHLTLGFAGNVGYGYGDALLDLIPVFRAHRTKVVMYGPPPGPQLAAGFGQAADCVELRGFTPTPQEAWESIKRDCDAVILPYPFACAKMETLIRHHFPSKLPEYLALGMPVLISGPEYATGVKWGLKHPDATAVAHTPDLVSRVLTSLLTDGAYRVRLAANSLVAGTCDFDPHQIRETFLTVLRQASADNPKLALR